MLLPLLHDMRAAGDIQNPARGEGGITNCGLRKVVTFQGNAVSAGKYTDPCDNIR
jgi:hypothetical protein